jgi:ubiquinone/menaquinone biosynthesis C-methylase UbiE
MSLNPLLAREERYLSPLLTNLHERQILDLACGTGRWIENLLSRGATSAVGFDCSDAMLRVANKKRRLTGKLVRAACESLPFRTSGFDLAICSFAVGHVEGLECMTRELARVMRVGSDIFVSDLHPEAYARGWRVGFRDSTAAFQIEMFPRQAEEVIRAFSSSGFECLTCDALRLGDAEKAIFESAGKLGALSEACQVPAVLVYHFRGLASHPAGAQP